MSLDKSFRTYKAKTLQSTSKNGQINFSQKLINKADKDIEDVDDTITLLDLVTHGQHCSQQLNITYFYAYSCKHPWNI